MAAEQKLEQTLEGTHEEAYFRQIGWLEYPSYDWRQMTHFITEPHESKMWAQREKIITNITSKERDDFSNNIVTKFIDPFRAARVFNTADSSTTSVVRKTLEQIFQLLLTYNRESIQEFMKWVCNANRNKFAQLLGYLRNHITKKMQVIPYIKRLNEDTFLKTHPICNYLSSDVCRIICNYCLYDKRSETFIGKNELSGHFSYEHNKGTTQLAGSIVPDNGFAIHKEANRLDCFTLIEYRNKQPVISIYYRITNKKRNILIYTIYNNGDRYLQFVFNSYKFVIDKIYRTPIVLSDIDIEIVDNINVQYVFKKFMKTKPYLDIDNSIHIDDRFVLCKQFFTRYMPNWRLKRNLYWQLGSVHGLQIYQGLPGYVYYSEYNNGTALYIKMYKIQHNPEHNPEHTFIEFDKNKLIINWLVMSKKGKMHKRYVLHEGTVNGAFELYQRSNRGMMLQRLSDDMIRHHRYKLRTIMSYVLVPYELF